MNSLEYVIETTIYTFKSTRSLINILVMIFVGIIIFLLSLYRDRNEPQGKYRNALLRGGFAAYLYFILFITLLGRSAAGTPTAKWMPLWSWINVIQDYNRWHYIQEILLNVLLFMPLGFLLGAICKIKLWQALLCGFAVSFLVEIIQYFSCRGLFEWDDMIHNAVGCLLGALVINAVRKRWKMGIKVNTKFDH